TLTRARSEELLGPRVIADPIQDHELSRCDRAGIGRRRLVIVRVRVRVGDDARHLDTPTAELLCDAAPDVLRRDDARPAAPARGGDQALAHPATPACDAPVAWARTMREAPWECS